MAQIDRDDGLDAYYALLEMSEKIGWPLHYKTDLTEYDKQTLQDLSPQKFIWIVREMGTELLTLGPVAYRGQYTEKQRAGDINWMRLTVHGHPEARGFLFADGRLKEIDLKRAFPKVMLDERRSN